MEEPIRHLRRAIAGIEGAARLLDPDNRRRVGMARNKLEEALGTLEAAAAERRRMDERLPLADEDHVISMTRRRRR